MMEHDIFHQEMMFKVKPEMVLTEDNLGNKINKRMVGIQLGAYNDQINHVMLGPIKSLYYSINEVFFVCNSTLKYLFSILKGTGDSSQLEVQFVLQRLLDRLPNLAFYLF